MVFIGRAISFSYQDMSDTTSVNAPAPAPP